MSGSDFLQLKPGDARPAGLTAWLTEGLRAAIAAGRLTPGDRLPATRLLAAELGVSRGVVVQAYQRLADEGLAGARTGSGTVVTGRGPERSPRPAADRRRTLHQLRLPLSTPDGIEIDLSPGVPDLSAFPRAAWLRAERAVLGRVTAADLRYGDPGGTPRLRSVLVGWLARTRGVRCEADDVIVTAGVAQGLALLAHVLRARGTDAVAVEDPGSRGALDQMAFWGLRPVEVPVDGEGLRVGELAATGVTAAVLTPAHQFPTGVVLSPRRRRALLAWAADGNLIVEDDYDAEHRYDRAPVAAVQGSAPDRVAYLGSVSKSLAPGMRTGWLIAPRGMQAELLAAKHASDLGNPALPQLVLAELLGSGDYERHLRGVRTRQRSRRDALLAGLRAHLPEARVAGVAAGLHLLVTLPGPVEDTVLAERVAAAGVLVQPLSWHRRRPGPPGLVIGYAAHPPDRLTEAAARIGRALNPPGRSRSR
ncbi:MocR-like pyridoxine biosynthesis transcription factor PdxR [Actinoplanes derwentensis]|uniref:GntR family transcriptional regulator / MocR family aminotransferase n=1 Tax=Actinoplanes derwentensis TaxID=113562 RepID=A0A1H2BSY6_9ACTN|nr:PLP-dependent aminotransferase family protein [Actinoplanes derwentensis]GID83066.1 GntR family transcriptional regulator [Actinoplanes derwentensis]SDT61415.1 GntR family transcriptional regulator / MocR family aminotransferase [Actinoplanes derwentensis]